MIAKINDCGRYYRFHLGSLNGVRKWLIAGQFPWRKSVLSHHWQFAHTNPTLPAQRTIRTEGGEDASHWYDNAPRSRRRLQHRLLHAKATDEHFLPVVLRH